MTKSIPLESVMEKFRDEVNDGWNLGDLRYGIPDVRVMIRLGFTPQSWSRYRPLIIQYCQYNDLVKIEEREGVRLETINIRMQYDRKNKQWYGKRNPLHKIIDGAYQMMSPDELEKLKIWWLVDDGFQY